MMVTLKTAQSNQKITLDEKHVLVRGIRSVQNIFSWEISSVGDYVLIRVSQKCHGENKERHSIRNMFCLGEYVQRIPRFPMNESRIPHKMVLGGSKCDTESRTYSPS